MRRNRHRAARRRRGCFWSVESQTSGKAKSTSVGYRGDGDNPTYEQVSRGNTMHAEAVEIVYDEKVERAHADRSAWQPRPDTLNQAATAAANRSHVWYTTDAQRAVRGVEGRTRRRCPRLAAQS